MTLVVTEQGLANLARHFFPHLTEMMGALAVLAVMHNRRAG